MTSPTAATRLVALLGHPVAHSISPQIHNAGFAAVGLDAVYVALDVAPEQVTAAVAGVAALGLLGANVTVPHKQAVFAAVSHRAPAAAASGAANTLYWEDGRLTADNTDVAGLAAVLAEDVDLAPADGVVLFGAGGAARAAALALGGFGVSVEVVARRAEAAAEIDALLAQAGGRPAAVPEPRLVINATPLGLHGETLPARFRDLGEGQTALDLVYGAADTPFLATARAAGAKALDGRGMLVRQAAAAFERWTGRPAPLEVMARAAQAALRPTLNPGA